MPICTQGVTAGVLRGSGRQHLGVGVVFVGYCFIGLPIGISLMFLTPLRLSGILLFLNKNGQTVHIFNNV